MGYFGISGVYLGAFDLRDVLVLETSDLLQRQISFFQYLTSANLWLWLLGLELLCRHS